MCNIYSVIAAFVVQVELMYTLMMSLNVICLWFFVDFHTLTLDIWTTARASSLQKSRSSSFYRRPLETELSNCLLISTVCHSLTVMSLLVCRSYFLTSARRPRVTAGIQNTLSVVIVNHRWAASAT